jgi:hypothetical protein
MRRKFTATVGDGFGVKPRGATSLLRIASAKHAVLVVEPNCSY